MVTIGIKPTRPETGYGLSLIHIYLQENILSGIENKEIYAASTADEFEEIILSKGKIIGCVTEEDDLIAMGAVSYTHLWV